MLFILVSVYGQEKTDTNALMYPKNSYRENDFNKLIFKVSIDSDIENLYLYNYDRNQHANLTPNERYKLRFAADYKFLGIHASFSPKILPGNNDNHIKGETKTLDLSFKFFYSDRLRQEITYKKVKGFYDAYNTPLQRFSNTAINTYGGKTFFIANRNFSYRAFENQTERQLKPCGSLIPSISYYYRTILNKEPYTTGLFFREIHTWNAIAQLGYMYNFLVDKSWLITLGLHPGLGYSYSKISYKDNRVLDQQHITTFALDATLSTAHFGKAVFAGFKSNLRVLEHLTNVTNDFYRSAAYIHFFVGYKFKAPKKVKHFFEEVEEKYGL